MTELIEISLRAGQASIHHPLIEQLENPCTDEYEKLKEFVLSEQMKWNFYESTYSNRADKTQTKEIPLHSHVVMQRPYPEDGIPFSIIKSELFKNVYKVLEQIFKHNNKGVYVIYRINFNATFFNKSAKTTPWHTDLPIPHKNLLIYMNKFKSGQTLVKKGDVVEKFTPKEDDIIVFDGALDHCHNVPKEDERRVVLIANYL